jgi:hypothetical protein
MKCSSSPTDTVSAQIAFLNETQQLRKWVGWHLTLLQRLLRGKVFLCCYNLCTELRKAEVTRKLRWCRQEYELWRAQDRGQSYGLISGAILSFSFKAWESLRHLNQVSSAGTRFTRHWAEIRFWFVAQSLQRKQRLWRQSRVILY